MQQNTPTPTFHHPDKIMKIKHLRSFTSLLGKLGIECLRRDNAFFIAAANVGMPHPGPRGRGRIETKYVYGWGLKESKDFVENFLEQQELMRQSYYD